MRRLLLSLAGLLVTGVVFGQKFEQLARTPPMGWNSWNHFGCNINEQIVREVAEAMVRSGMRDAGEYVIDRPVFEGFPLA